MLLEKLTLSAPKWELINWKLYPTLVTDITTIFPPNKNDKYLIEIWDLGNLKQFFSEFSEGETILDTSKWVKGTYRIDITFKEQRHSYKVLKTT
ncbi:T9SS type A sorting domain-containing protein [Flammeovirga agarivorans]|uniref:T9SS type A sorting domain-containing protein n=1 Tax=Flammeovirga agarivorans TaxID=2726742 RepID=A0A7X8SNN1_9BACT|nr:T9SS type A sorting domain-containing protein [Flammeovirga agarivorans]NLR93555.1 T9SS type A sorting domain-containing protein [Flammeovirga agarivorans]